MFANTNAIVHGGNMQLRTPLYNVGLEKFDSLRVSKTMTFSTQNFFSMGDVSMEYS